jgi:hypothetical protein
MNKPEANTFDILDEKSHNELYVTLVDNQETDIPQFGIGKDDTGVYVVDLNPDNGTNTRGKLYVTPGMRVMDVVKAGVDSQVFEERSSDDIRFRVDDDLQGEWDEFYNKILGEAFKASTEAPVAFEDLEEFLED